MSLEFRYAAYGEYPQIASFLDQYWAADHVYVRTPSLFEWTFRRPDFWDPGSYSFALAEDHGDIVGILGGIPFDFNRFGETQRGVWIVNYAVRPDHRKGAAALKLLSMFRNPSFPVVIASGLNPASAAIYRVLRGQVLQEAPRHFLALPHAFARMKHILLLANPEWPANRADELARRFQIPEMPEPHGHYGNYLPEDWDQANWSHIAAGTIGAVRDAKYMAWRYVQHPCFDYRFVTLQEGDRTGLLVWRLETIRQEVNGQGRVDIDRIGRVVEFLPASAENGRKLLAGFVCRLREADAAGADFYGYHGFTRSMLADNDFHKVETHPDGPFIPSRFQPLSPGAGILNAMFADPTLPDCAGQPDCPWYWTKSDSDQDRPN